MPRNTQFIRLGIVKEWLGSCLKLKIQRNVYHSWEKVPLSDQTFSILLPASRCSSPPLFYDFEYEMYDHEWRNGVLYERVLKHGYNTGIDIAWHVMEGFFFFEFTRKILCENSIVQNELNDKLLIRMERFMYLWCGLLYCITYIYIYIASN